MMVFYFTLTNIIFTYTHDHCSRTFAEVVVVETS